MSYLRNLKSKLEQLAFGRSGEAAAASFLKKRGYDLLETNYRCRAGEIDIVAREAGVLVFCEVKARRGKSHGTALEGVTPQKARKLRAAAEDYLVKKSLTSMDVRFDVVTIDPGPDGKPRMELIRNAF